MKRFLRFALIAALTATAFSACRKEPQPPGGNGGGISEDASAEIKWIYETLCDEYYWNAAVKAASPDTDLEYDVFLERLLLSLGTAARDSDGTMDGKGSGGDRYLYSYIDRTPVGTRAEIDNNTYTTFGFGIYPVGTRDNIELIITWVQPGGPADAEELVRGMRITAYNGEVITWDDYVDFFYTLYNLEDTRIDMTVGGRDITLNARSMDVNPILFHDVLTSGGGKKVGYLVYNEFHPGANDRYDDELRQIFGEFNTAGVNEIVIDLRYNLGGYVSSCRALTALIANPTASQIFGKYKLNDGILYPERFESEPNALKNLNGKKVYVLATEDSASASEMVINSLRGIDFEVVHIGWTTEGKNVGMELSENTIEGYDYEMWPITFRIYNAKDQSDYPNGFTPTRRIDEFRNWQTGIYPFGDARERLLATALTLIDGGTVVNDPATRAEEGPGALKQSPSTKRGGAKLIPAEVQKLRNDLNAEE